MLRTTHATAALLLMSAAAQAQVSSPQQATGPTDISSFAIKAGAAVGNHGRLVKPDSSIAKPADAGRRAHTNVEIFVPEIDPQHQSSTAAPSVGTPFPGRYYETPGSLSCIYHMTPVVSGCDPNSVTQVKTAKGSRLIAIVDAYHNPSALSDLQYYSAQFGLPAPNLQVVYAAGTQPPQNYGWGLEEALDVQMAHALAPSAKIVLVEAATNSYVDLLQAEDVASSMVAAAGGGQVSNSWGGSEFSSETSYDSHFTTSGVTYFASTGDDPGTSFPSVSSNVVAVGGTSTSRSPFTGAFEVETSWVDGGGGSSPYVARPSYQDSISSIVGTHRGVPDVSAVANPRTPVLVYCTTGCSSSGWYTVGGTSVSSPLVASLMNANGLFAPSSAAALQGLYAVLGTNKLFDVTNGTCGPYAGFLSATGWDYCTGVGSPRKYKASTCASTGEGGSLACNSL